MNIKLDKQGLEELYRILEEHKAKTEPDKHSEGMNNFHRKIGQILERPEVITATEEVERTLEDLVKSCHDLTGASFVFLIWSLMPAVFEENIQQRCRAYADALYGFEQATAITGK